MVQKKRVNFLLASNVLYNSRTKLIGIIKDEIQKQNTFVESPNEMITTQYFVLIKFHWR